MPMRLNHCEPMRLSRDRESLSVAVSRDENRGGVIGAGGANVAGAGAENEAGGKTGSVVGGASTLGGGDTAAGGAGAA